MLSFINSNKEVALVCFICIKKVFIITNFVFEIFGFGIYHLEHEQIKLINFDIISNDLEQKSKNVIRGFRFLRQQNWYKKIDKSKYSVWCDTGKSFRCAQTIGYLFKELASEKIHGMMFKLFYNMRQFFQ